MLRSRLFKAGLALTLGQNLIHRFCLGTSALLFISKLWKIKLLLIQTGIVEKYLHVSGKIALGFSLT
jgi:hypothetical protein